MNVNIEFYYENGVYGAYIGSDGGSGIDVKGGTREECAENLTPYLLDFLYEVGEDEVEDEGEVEDEDEMGDI
jgi:hypothetical protein